MKPKHPGGRPPKPASERASADINIRTTKATKAKLKAAAKVCEVTLSAFVLSAAVEKANTPASNASGGSQSDHEQPDKSG